MDMRDIKKELSLVVSKARSGFDIWSQFSLDERLEDLERVSEYLRELRNPLVASICEETGKPSSPTGQSSTR